MTERLSAAEWRKHVGAPPPGDDLVRFRSEDEFQSTVIRWLDALDWIDEVFVFHPANGGKRSLITAAILQRMGVRPGVGDLCLMLGGGRVAWLELKLGTGQQSDAQKDFARICKRLGHPYAVAWTFDEVVAALTSFGVRYREPLAARLIREGG